MRFISNLRGLALTVAATLALAGPAMAQAYDGDWTGSLEVGPNKLRLALHVKTDKDGLSAVLDSLDQGATIPSTAAKTDGGELNLLFLSIGGELTAKLSPDGHTLVGTWSQGGKLPLTLTKQPAAGK